MSARRLWSEIKEMNETPLRLQVVVPLLRATQGITSVTDVHGQNEKGLDIIFTVDNPIERLTYGLQLKAGAISGGGTGAGTVKQVVDQLQLADEFEHPIVTLQGTFRIDRFVVAASGSISSTAREEITRRVKKLPVQFWDLDEIVRRVHQSLPQLLELSDGETVLYLKSVTRRYDVLDALDQIPGVAKRTLSQVFVERKLRRNYDPTVATPDGDSSGRSECSALSLPGQRHNAVIVGDQDSGKTSILRMLAITHAHALLAGDKTGQHDHCGVPVLVRARDILSGALRIEDAISAEFHRVGAQSLIATLDADLEEGNYFVLVDGFSEFPKSEDKEALARQLEEFAASRPKVRLIVAARTSDFLTPSLLPGFYQYSLAEFDDQQVGKLLRNWTGGSKSYEDVAQRMVHRLREALQLPGSPIPATIGVMLHEEQGKFVTNTAEAIDRYMVIRLGRYAHEIGMRQEVEWTRKQDLLAEIAFGMIEQGEDLLSEQEFVDRFDLVSRRQGDSEVGQVAFRELRDSGVLVDEGGRFGFHRSSFRDFFAGHHIFRRLDVDQFAELNFSSRAWGAAIVFATGLRRANSRLLTRLAVRVDQQFAAAIGNPSDDAMFAAFVLGRMLSNSESSDHEDRVAALRTVLSAVVRSIPGFEEVVVEQYGQIGRLMALLGAEQSLFITLGVPWLRKQLLTLIDDEASTEEERFILASTYAHLGFDDAYRVVERAVKGAQSTRVIIATDILVKQLSGSRKVQPEEQEALLQTQKLVKRRLRGRSDEVKRVLELKSPVLEVERKRLQRLMAKELRKT